MVITSIAFLFSLMYYAVDMERLLMKLHDKYRQLKVYGQKNGDSVAEKESKSTKSKISSMSDTDQKAKKNYYDIWEMRKNNALFKEMCIECGLPAPKWYYMKENIDPKILQNIHYLWL